MLAGTGSAPKGGGKLFSLIGLVVPIYGIPCKEVGPI